MWRLRKKFKKNLKNAKKELTNGGERGILIKLLRERRPGTKKTSKKLKKVLDKLNSTW
jgi:hypothetical protein